MAYKIISPAPVVEGGTGSQSFTANGVIFSGTTSTGAFQSIASLGTAGFVLTSTGVSTLATFQSVPSGDSNVVFPIVSSDPGSAVDGDVWFNSTETDYRCRANGANFMFNVT